MNQPMLAALCAALAVECATAQLAPVHWRVEDGGNGHWYATTTISEPFWGLQAHCESRGGYLASLTSPAEHSWVANTFVPRRMYVGAYQDRRADDYAEPNGGWRWVSGEPFVVDPTIQGFDDSGSAQDFGWFNPCCLNAIDDFGPTVESGIVEWSADCNNDGIVDFGQIQAGELADADGNGVPDCCDQRVPCSPQSAADCNADGIADVMQIERGQFPDFNSDGIPDCCAKRSSCELGEYAVEWKTSRGGNGHWYVRSAAGSIFELARVEATQSGGSLATLTSEAEWLFVANINRSEWTLLGGFQPPNSCEPLCDWRWVTGEPWSYAGWLAGQPDNYAGEDVLGLLGPGWNDFPMGHFGRYWIEFDADCNGDGIVDLGQILAGALPDVNSNNIPDGCQCPADLNGDGLVGASDLPVLLNAWGTTGASDADLNGDGFVGAADLTELLSNWGVCGR